MGDSTPLEPDVVERVALAPDMLTRDAVLSALKEKRASEISYTPAAVISECISLIESLPAAISAQSPPTDQAEDEAYEIGKRDGRSEAMQELDLATGGDGEYRYCTNHDPDRHCPDEEAMKARIVARCFAQSPRLEEMRELSEKIKSARNTDECLSASRRFERACVNYVRASLNSGIGGGS